MNRAATIRVDIIIAVTKWYKSTSTIVNQQYFIKSDCTHASLRSYTVYHALLQVRLMAPDTRERTEDLGE
jgi:hypothetical protein